jgi:tetratricopeptide (TPR) repeat protein
MVPGVVGAFTEPADRRPELPQGFDPAEGSSPGLLSLDALLQPPPPEPRRTEAEADRVEALARFCAGRALERHDQYARALRHYQRALRYDPESEAVAEAAVRLAVELDRLDEAIRLAQRVQDADVLDAVLWMKLGVHLRKKGDWDQAAAMYENALAVRADAKPTVGDVALKLELARVYYLVGEYEKGAEAFAFVREAVEHPERFGLDRAAQRGLLAEPGATHVLMGNCCLRAGRVDEAVAAFEESHRLQPNKGLLGYNLALAQVQTGKPAEALAKLQAYFDEHLATEGMAPYRLLARILEDLDREHELLERLEKLHAEDEENVPLGYFLAKTYHEAEQFDEAESLYRALVDKTPTVTGHRALVAIARQTNRPEALLDALGAAAAQGVAAESFAGEGESIADDAALVSALIEIARKRREHAPDPCGFGPARGVALLALDAGRFEAAGEFFEEAVRADPDRKSEIFLTWGLGLLAQEQYGLAAGVFRRAIDDKVLPDDNPVLYFYLSGALELDGRTEEALAVARKAAALDPDSARFRSRVAWILYRNDRHQEAAQSYSELIERFDHEFRSAEVRQVMREARLVLSSLAVSAGKFDEAQRWLEEVLDEFPDDVGALNDLGYLWADRGVHLQRAHRMIREAVAGDPDNVAYRDSLGWVLYRLGRVEEAVVELEKAAEDEEPDPVILDHFGDAYHAARQTDKAKKAWTRAVQIFEQHDDAEMAKTVQQKLSENP